MYMTEKIVIFHILFLKVMPQMYPGIRSKKKIEIKM
jgi:hypothetical protein